MTIAAFLHDLDRQWENFKRLGLIYLVYVGKV